MPDQPPTLYTDFLLENGSGWGCYGLNLLKYATMRGIKIRAIMKHDLKLETLPLFDQDIIKPVIKQSKKMTKRINEGGVIEDENGIFLTHMNWDNDLRQSYEGLKVKRQFGVVFFHNLTRTYGLVPKIAPDAYEAIICGSSWNAEHLRKAGYKKAVTVLQGVNSNHFFPRIAPLANDGKFYIFSGGKLEIRKGQDLVMKAFKLIQDKLPNARLVTNWAWRQEAAFANQYHKAKTAQFAWVIEKNTHGFSVNIPKTAMNYGIDPSRIICLKMTLNHRIAQIMQQCHMAVFPNRAEGGTNLVAMEAIATGLPSVIGYNTGQKDLFKICPDLHEIGLTSDTKPSDKMPSGSDSETKENIIDEQGFHSPNEVADRILQIYNNYDHYQQLG